MLGVEVELHFIWNEGMMEGKERGRHEPLFMFYLIPY